MARNIKFDENAKWNWESNLVETTNNRILGSGSLPEVIYEPDYDPDDTEFTISQMLGILLFLSSN